MHGETLKYVYPIYARVRASTHTENLTVILDSVSQLAGRMFVTQ